jgi:hypothetical protein
MAGPDGLLQCRYPLRSRRAGSVLAGGLPGLLARPAGALAWAALPVVWRPRALRRACPARGPLKVILVAGASWLPAHRGCRRIVVAGASWLPAHRGCRRIGAHPGCPRLLPLSPAAPAGLAGPGNRVRDGTHGRPARGAPPVP